MRTLKSGVAVALALAAAACSSGGTTKEQVPPSGVVLSFTSNPASLAAAGEVELAWTTQDATSVELTQVGVGPVTIDPLATDGTVKVMLTRSAAFLFQAHGEGGTDARPLGIEVGSSSSGLLFDAVPRQVEPGDPVTLTWYAPGASSITLKEAGVGAIDALGQTVSGSVVVHPTRSATYRIEMNGSRSAVAEVQVLPVIRSFALLGTAPAPGGMVTLAWTTGGGQMLTLSRPGAPMLYTSTDATKLSAGEFVDTVPATALPSGVITYTLTLVQGTTTLTRDVEVRLAGAVSIGSFTVPHYAHAGADLPVSWTTTGAGRLELRQDGNSIFLAGSAAQAAAGNTQVRMPVSVGALTTLSLLASDATGSLATREVTVETVGLPAFNAFTASTTTLAQGSNPVTLSWDVTNAHHVRLTDKLTRTVVADRSGALAQGSAVVFPNRPSVTYVLDADNGAGDAIASHEVTITVTTLAQLTYARRLPPGAPVSLTGHTVTGGLQLFGLPTVAKNQAGDAFVDIRATGTELTSLLDTTPQVVNVPPFGTVLWGRRITVDRVTISPNGWLVVGPNTASSPLSPGSPLGTSLDPLAIAPWASDLYFSSAAHAHWQEDLVAGVPRLIVQWTDVEEFASSATRLTFQVQLFGSGKVVLAYQRVEKATATPGVGIVNGSETDEVGPTTTPVAGDTYSFFTSPVTPPLSIKAEDAVYVAQVSTAQGVVEVEGDPRSLLAITEVNPRPAATAVDGEWVEITNTATTADDLQGFTLDFGGGATFTFPSALAVPAGGRVLVAQAANLGDGSSVTAAATYPNTLLLADGPGTLKLRFDTAVASQGTWDAAQTSTAGVSVVFDPRDLGSVYAAGVTQLGCVSTAGTYGVSAQVGSPGAANPRCFPYILSKLATGAFETLGDAGVLLQGPLLADGGTANDVLLPLTLATPITLFGQPSSTLTVSTNGFVAVTAPATSLPINRTTPSTPAVVAPFWDDLVVTPGAYNGIFTAERDPDGTPGNGDEYAIVSWEGVRPSATTGASLSFQVKLFASGRVEYHYGALSGPAGATTPFGSGATVWLEHPGGKQAQAVSVNQVALSSGSGYRYTPVP